MNRTRWGQGLPYARIAGVLCTNAGMAAAGVAPLVFAASLVTPAVVLPILSVVYLTAAGLLALIARSIRRDRNSNRITLWDLSGACAFLGFAAGILSTPEDVMTAFSVGVD